jgi:hypothetical protein
VISDQDNRYGGLTGFSSVPVEDHESNLLLSDNQRQLREIGVAVPYIHLVSKSMGEPMLQLGIASYPCSSPILP